MMIKKHWPVLFAILMVIISIILGIGASQSADAGAAIAVGVIIFMFLFPLAGAVIGGWYGWRLQTPLKWLLAPVAYLGVILYLVIEGLIYSAESADVGAYATIGILTGIACLAVEIASSAIAWMAKRNKRKKEAYNE